MGLETPVFIGRVLLVLAAITTTVFPLLYLRVAWYKTRLGRAVMIQSIALSLAMWLKLSLTLLIHMDLDFESSPLMVWINNVILLLIIIATVKLTAVQWWYLHHDRELERR